MDLSRYDDVTWQEAVRDCWWLVRDFYEWNFGVLLPRICVNSAQPLVVRREFRRNPARKLFRKLGEPVHCCVVELTQDHSADHVGVFLLLGGRQWLLHNERGSGVCVTPMDEIKMQYKIKGFFEYVG